ncbi:uncharacterized protein CCOS01_05024 [Colletotrichum costaricense]|uniref:Uncharacterized protein n=1 Tax=Colletotrichum costaricense TaxID=1209916 RepID=A0AAI9Z3Z0_9PEZI|nr:uncharacterized protein CCOS01_05024 [Colletotrichum costaricense]KAK1533041.1 hypothetical protein CCOS01_05024 [Colletotrichum costaricense]
MPTRKRLFPHRQPQLRRGRRIPIAPVDSTLVLAFQAHLILAFALLFYQKYESNQHYLFVLLVYEKPTASCHSSFMCCSSSSVCLGMYSPLPISPCPYSMSLTSETQFRL